MPFATPHVQACCCAISEAQIEGYQAAFFLLQLVSSAAEAGAVLAGSDGDACRDPGVLTSALGAGERAAWKAPAFDRALCACSCWIVGIGPGTPTASTPGKTRLIAAQKLKQQLAKSTGGTVLERTVDSLFVVRAAARHLPRDDILRSHGEVKGR